ncbi:MAG: HD domain-containing protein [Acidobacteriota bacterium]
MGSPRLDSVRLDSTRLDAQIGFLVEIDRLKTILRRTVITDGSRQENSAEHSWHIAMMATVLAEHAADEGVDVSRVIRLLLVHDIVEIDAGDTFCYDAEAASDQSERERRAADRLFGLLPPDQAEELRAAWDEFEEGTTPEARFAWAIDRLQPLLLNHRTGGYSWRLHGVAFSQAVGRFRVLESASPGLWAFALGILEEARDKGWLRDA